jgi:hypothetical protein
MKSQIVLDKDGYVESYAFIGILPNGIDFDNFPSDIEDFKIHFRSYKLIDDALYKNEERAKELQLECEKDILRLRRKVECFDYINRGALWYNRLTENQKNELNIWYE